VSAPRHYDIRVTLAGLDELKVHRLDGGEILLDDLVQRPAALVSVTLDATYQSDVGIGVDEHFHIT